MYEAGGWVLLESAIADLPADLRWLFESGAVTLEQLAAIYRRARGDVGGRSGGCGRANGALGGIDGVGPEVETAVAAALPLLRVVHSAHSAGPRDVASSNRFSTRCARPLASSWAQPAGSLRRGQDTVGDIEIVAACADPAPIVGQLPSLGDEARCLHRSERRIYILSTACRSASACRLPRTPAPSCST